MTSLVACLKRRCLSLHFAPLGNGNPDEAIRLRLMLLRGPNYIVNRMHGADSSLRLFQPKFVHGESPSAEYAKLRKESLEGQFGRMLGSKSVSVLYRFGTFLAVYKSATISFYVLKLTIWRFFVHDMNKRSVKFREMLIRLGPFYIKILVPAQGSYFIFRILNGSVQAIDSFKDLISIYFSRFLRLNSSLGLNESRSVSRHRNEVEETSEAGDKEPRGAVFNALDAMLKGSLDRLKTMRESIRWVHSSSYSVIFESASKSDISMIRALCLEGKLGSAFCLWQTVVQQLRIPDVLTHNYLLNALCKSGDLERAEWLVNEMLAHGPRPSCATYNTLMSGYCLVNQVDTALDVFSTMVNRGVRPNRVSCNILVHSLCRKGLLQDATKLLEKILDDNNDGGTSKLIASTILMDGHIKGGSMVEAISCWNDVIERGIEVDVVAYNVINHGYCLSGNLTIAYRSLGKMYKSGLDPDIFSYNTVISELCKSGRIDEACYVFGVMSRMGIPPDHITYKMIIQGSCIHGDVHRATYFVSHMLQNSSVPKPLIWNVMIVAYGKRGQVQEALFMKNKMIELGVLPNVYTYNALIYTQIKDGSIDKAHYLLTEMLFNGLSPDVVTYNLLIGAACDMGDISFALQLHNEMLRRGCEPDIITYTELLKCYCIRNKMEEAEELLFKMLMTNLPIDHVPFIILMKKCFKMGEINKVYNLYCIWLRRGRNL
ncbi:pentatricopeptide repeat-containing protein At5g24830 isoform X2 [Salvia miltiorrhiza]|uniref:pentatricopeptide repeat-containing protein At5g24830 isoform X2 n=1 Tax=Salvia miltiorrhiza TaxID=226208 RepID=UPI0025AD3B35|nr:pentatricopeptide repeat-containing protein At5g24830 isoform X2 [Salvia miltiorrhiza]